MKIALEGRVLHGFYQRVLLKPFCNELVEWNVPHLEIFAIANVSAHPVEIRFSLPQVLEPSGLLLTLRSAADIDDSLIALLAFL
jgi:hypothetical protein